MKEFSLVSTKNVRFYHSNTSYSFHLKKIRQITKLCIFQIEVKFRENDFHTSKILESFNFTKFQQKRVYSQIQNCIKTHRKIS